MPEQYNDADVLAAQRTNQRRRYDQGVEEWHTQHDEPNTAHLLLQAILACSLCDEDGYRVNGFVCDHVDRSRVAAAGSAKVRAALAKKGKP